MKHLLERTAAVGLAAWALWGIALATDVWMEARLFPIVEWLTLLGPLAVVPLGVRLLRTDDLDAEGEGEDRRAWRILVRALPLGALATALSLVVDRGVAAGVLAAGWLAITGLVARRGTKRMRRPGTTRGALAERAIDVACVYLLVGGVMWVAARSGLSPLGLTEPTVTLAATHFHFAGFALLVVAGEVGRAIGAAHGTVWGPVRAAFVASIWIVMLAPALVAVGITVWPGLEMVASVALALGAAVVGLVMAGSVAPRIGALWPAALVAMAGLALVAGMTAAAVYATGVYAGRSGLPLSVMVPLHGVANGVFFGLGGLAGLRWARARVPGRRARGDGTAGAPGSQSTSPSNSSSP